MTPEQLAAFSADAAPFHSALTSAFSIFGIATPASQAMFIAQCAHESLGFRRLEEDLRYSAERLQQVFARRFTASDAATYAGHPQLIANRAYAGKNGNGDETSGDGFKYRGRGLIQITGRTTYDACSRAMSPTPRWLLDTPDALVIPIYAAESAGWYWRSHGCELPAQNGDIERVTKLINGGLNGIEDRRNWWLKAKAALGVK